MPLLGKRPHWLIKSHVFVLLDGIQAAQSGDAWLMSLLRYAYDFNE